MSDKCKSCGIPWTDHLGIEGTCAKLQTLIAGLEKLVNDPSCLFQREYERKEIKRLLKEVQG